jgi:hypothetical protein
VSADAGHAVLDAAVEHGVTFFDTSLRAPGAPARSRPLVARLARDDDLDVGLPHCWP